MGELACQCSLHVNVSPVRRGKSSRYDPSGTSSIRNAYVRDVEKHYRTLARAIHRKVVTENYFNGHKRQPIAALEHLETLAFQFSYDPEKLGDFERWLEGQMRAGDLINAAGTERLATAEGIWADGYIKSAYKQGVQRGSDELKKQGVEGVISPTGQIDDGFGYGFIAPVTKDDLAALYLRNYEALNGINKELAAKISTTLANGFANGLSPWAIARDLTKLQDITKNRARTIARTEVIRAHHRGLFRQYTASGVKGVTFQVEWLATPDDRVCKQCADLSGKVFDLKDMEYAIPVHPNCRCVMIPSTKDLEEGQFEEPFDELEGDVLTEADMARMPGFVDMGTGMDRTAGGGMPGSGMGTAREFATADDLADSVQFSVRRGDNFVRSMLGDDVLDEYGKLLNDPRFVLKKPVKLAFGVDKGGVEFAERQIASSGKMSFAGTRTMGLTPERAARYARVGSSEQGVVYEVVMPKGSRVAWARPFDLPEGQLLPGSEYKLIRTQTRTMTVDGMERQITVKTLELLDDGSKHAADILRTAKDIDTKLAAQAVKDAKEAARIAKASEAAKLAAEKEAAAKAAQAAKAAKDAAEVAAKAKAIADKAAKTATGWEDISAKVTDYDTWKSVFKDLPINVPSWEGFANLGAGATKKLNAIVREFTRMKTDFPNFMEAITCPSKGRMGLKIFNEVVLDKDGTLGMYWYSRHSIDIIGKSAFRSGKLSIGSYTADSSTLGTLRHEVGHGLWKSMKLNKGEWNAVYVQSGGGKRLTKTAISKYGMTNSEEGFCEAFSAFTHPDYALAKRRLPKEIDDFLTKLLGKKVVAAKKATKAAKAAKAAKVISK